MVTHNTLAELEEAGVHVYTPDGKTLRAKAPGGISRELRERIQANKQDIIHAIQQRELDAYDERGWLAIYSTHLDEVVIVAKDDDAARAAPAGFVTYTADEIAHLKGTEPDALRQVHEAKKFWSGRVTGREAGRA